MMPHPMANKMPSKRIPQLLYRWMLLGPKRQYVIDKIKKPLVKAITTLAFRYPEPTMENTTKPNTSILLKIRDKFFEYEDNQGRVALFRALWRMFIVEYEHDPYYQYRIDWMLEEVIKSGWVSRVIRDEQCWKEPMPEDFKPKRQMTALLRK